MSEGKSGSKGVFFSKMGDAYRRFKILQTNPGPQNLMDVAKNGVKAAQEAGLEVDADYTKKDWNDPIVVVLVEFQIADMDTKKGKRSMVEVTLLVQASLQKLWELRSQ